MKKTYISPEFLLVELRGSQMLAESLGKQETGADENIVLTKEYNTLSDKSIWDNEW